LRFLDVPEVDGGEALFAGDGPSEVEGFQGCGRGGVEFVVGEEAAEVERDIR
jgi:hypothetical protein